jgi:hypothetical protein
VRALPLDSGSGQKAGSVLAELRARSLALRLIGGISMSDVVLVRSVASRLPRLGIEGGLVVNLWFCGGKKHCWID